MADPQLLTAIGAVCAIFFACAGASSASSLAGVYAIQTKGWRSMVPIVISGVLGIYGTIIAVILAGKLQQQQQGDELTTAQGYQNLCAGLAVGLTCFTSGQGMSGFLGMCIYGPMKLGRSNDFGNGEGEGLLIQTAGRHRLAEPAPVTVKFMMVLTFLEALGLYGLIAGLLLVGNETASK
jgi:V-type H+-transporting ATPase proteolipid subunit